jgi:transcriptional regulator of acetoin/glycerol metabolism
VIRIGTIRQAEAEAACSRIDAEETFKSAKARAIAQFEKNYLRDLLTEACGNVSLAARISHKDRSTLNKLVKKHGLASDRFRTGLPRPPR